MANTINKLKDRAVFRLKAFGRVPNRLYDEVDYAYDYGGADALLLLSDLVRHLKSEDIYVGPGYGYSTCSLLCFGLGITDIEPEKWDLPFECFTNSFNQDNEFRIETSTGGFEKAVEFLNHRCEYPISIVPEKNHVIDIVLLDDQQFSNLHLAITHNINLDIIKALSVERTIKPSKIELDQKALDFFRNGDTNDIYGFAATTYLQKGHAISRAMMSVELAYYKAIIPYRYKVIQRLVRIEAIKAARDRIRKRTESQNQESNINSII